MAWQLYQGDALETLKQMEDESINCCVTSPPYWGLRDYGVEGQLGLEPTPEEYVANMVEVFREVKRVLRKDGTLWLNLGDTYNGTKIGNTETKKNPRVVSDSFIKKSAPNVKVKDLIGIPWMVAFALRADGWWLRSDIIWAKGNPMPESVQDRPTKSHEYIFLLSKSKKYFYDADAIAEPVTNSTINRLSQNIEEQAGSDRIPPKRNKRTVWNINTKPYKEAHFATFPPDLIKPCILAGTSPRACEICGAPWERVVEREPMEIKRSGRGVALGKYGKTAASGTMTKPATSVTTGWQPTCTCQNEGKGRCIVLDPFAGAGTTLYVAEQLGRNSIGIELNPDYCDIIRRRMAGLEMNLFLAK
jgi:DNA modification methylase